jgi:hypothetical protein
MFDKAAGHGAECRAHDPLALDLQVRLVLRRLQDALIDPLGAARTGRRANASASEGPELRCENPWASKEERLLMVVIEARPCPEVPLRRAC